MTSSHPDPYRDIDGQPDPAQFIEALETRGRTPNHARLLRGFLKAVPVRTGQAVLEVGCGTGVVVRELAACVGARGRVVGVDPSRWLVRAAGRFLGGHPRRHRITLRVAPGQQLPFAADRFDVTVAVTVLLHVADPLAVVKEMVRVTRPGGLVAVQDQDFGTVALAHPDRALTDLILGGVAARIYEEPYSGRRLPGLLRTAGLERVRLLTSVYQDTTLERYSKAFVERRAENAVKFGLVDEPSAQRWLDELTRLVAEGAFVLTINYYGGVGVKPGGRQRR